MSDRTEKRTETVAAKVTPDTKAKLMKIVKRERRTESWIANEYIEEGIARDEKRKRNMS
jgi:predicted transcriptional regulator